VSVRPLRVLLAGGGTAGHVSPLLALADCLRRRDPEAAVLVLGTAEGLESRLVPARGYDLAQVPRVPMPRRPSKEVLRLPGRLSAAVDAATAAVDRVRADVVVGFGGYVSAPAYLAARRRRLPLVVHEQNSRPGLANRLGARASRHVAVTFPGTPLRGGVVTGMPLRQEISDLDRDAERPAARAAFGLDPDRTTLLVTGGSLGAQRINQAVAAVAADVVAAGVQVLHVAGGGKAAGIDVPAERPGGAPYRVVEYVDRMEQAYAAADLVVCRAGASTVCEISAVGLPAVYVPLAIGNGEQRHNAEPVVASGGGLLVDDADLTPGWLRAHLLPLLADAERRAEVAAAAARAGVRDGDERLADMVVAAAREGR
jgi:UDP-N-acetylglucosamine--N-acetylmuramyl-(pentapeptide) pyrophosphoryl-undecaprenol N-acetylglucosamine transferase